MPGFAGRHDFSRYFAEVSLKDGAGLDWDSESERNAFLTGLVVDSDSGVIVDVCVKPGNAHDAPEQGEAGVAQTLGDCAYGTAPTAALLPTTAKGLKVTCRLDRRKSPAGLKVSDEKMKGVNLERHKFHGDWNYTIRPRSTRLT